MTTKVCPMPNVGECLKEKCAWWEGEQERCAVLDIALSLDAIWQNKRKKK